MKAADQQLAIRGLPLFRISGLALQILEGGRWVEFQDVARSVAQASAGFWRVRKNNRGPARYPANFR